MTDVRRPPSAQKVGGPNAGDLFVEVGPADTALSARTTGDALEARRPEGTHFQKPADRRMLGSFVIAGPGVAQGADLGVIQQIDIAPTLAALLGMDPLAHAEGKPLPRRWPTTSPPWSVHELADERRRNERGDAVPLRRSGHAQREAAAARRRIVIE